MSFKTFISINLLLLIFASCRNATADSARQEGENNLEALPSQDSKRPLPFTLKNDTIAKQFLKAYGEKHSDSLVRIETDFGLITLKLYSGTPFHKANFLFLVNEYNYFDGTWFHRVSPNHVVQGGNNDEPSLQRLRAQIGSYKIPAEFSNRYFHKYGAVAMARSYKGNPAKLSDPFEFYISLGPRYSASQLSAMEEQYSLKLTAHQKQVYQELGGSPHLDKEHTVFGEVIEGMSVVEAIAMVKTDRGEWPLTNIPLKISLQKLE
jgi:peptidyl-prolyl cis-trans isomerase A (cyclophilin A)